MIHKWALQRHRPVKKSDMLFPELLVTLVFNLTYIFRGLLCTGNQVAKKINKMRNVLFPQTA